jgi:hypothetical protein
MDGQEVVGRLNARVLPTYSSSDSEPLYTTSDSGPSPSPTTKAKGLVQGALYAALPTLSAAQAWSRGRATIESE